MIRIRIRLRIRIRIRIIPAYPGIGGQTLSISDQTGFINQ